MSQRKTTTNHRAKPPILIVSEKTTRLGLGGNKYLDPADGAQYEPDDLTPTEKGHRYLWWTSTLGVTVRMPLRCCDQETAELLRGKELSVADNTLSSPVLSTRVTSVFDHFSFTRQEDFDQFCRQARNKGWTVEPVSALSSELVAAMELSVAKTKELAGEILQWDGRYLSHAHTTAVVSQLSAVDRDLWLRGAQDQLVALSQAVTAFTDEQVPLRSLCVGAAQSDSTKEFELAVADTVRATGELLSLWAGSPARRRSEMEAVFAAATAGKRLNLAGYRLPLAAELARLKETFPSAQRLEAVTSGTEAGQLLLRLPGNVAVRLLPDGSVQLEGSLADLQVELGMQALARPSTRLGSVRAKPK